MSWTPLDLVHDLSMVQREADRHSKSVTCSCRPDVEPVGSSAAIVYHLPMADIADR